jgi:hypothetical protein
MAAQRSLEPLILVRIQAPLPTYPEMIVLLDEDPHPAIQPNNLTNEPRASRPFA